jgi:hypothetical protein
MFSMLRVAFTLLICILIVGFYLGWFAVGKASRDPQTNKENINLSVDKNKMGKDLQTFEHKVAEGIQDINNQPQGKAPTPPPGQQPRLNLEPLSLQPSGQPVQPTGDHLAAPPWSLGPISIQPSNPAEPNAPPTGEPQIHLQTPDFQFTVPLGPPPPGEGR